MPVSTQAIICHELNGAPQLEDVVLDDLRAEEVLVEIHASGICHTDLSCMNGTIPGSFPIIHGHEGAGVVLEVGSSVKSVAPGDKVLLSYNYCNECKACKKGWRYFCMNNFGANFSGLRFDQTHTVTTKDGKKVFANFFGQSSFSRKTIVQLASVVKVPPETPLELFAPLGCGVQTGVGSVLNTLNVQEGSSLVVFGVGTVGLSALMAGKLRGASPLIAVDVQPERLQIAKELGATHVVNGKDADCLDQIKKLCPPNGAEYAVDCSGVIPVISTMIQCLGTRGKAAAVGAPSPGKKVEIDVFEFLVMGKQYLGCCEGECIPGEIIPYLVQKHAEGKFPLDKIVTYYDVKDYKQAFDDVHHGKTIKAVLKWK